MKRWDEYELLEAGATLIDNFLDDEKWFTYTYDFGDNWRHRVTIEKVLTEYEYNYAQIIKYKGDTPYEDCGGIDGYYELLEILNEPKHPEYRHMKEWTENHFTEKFDVEIVNERLKQLCLSDTASDSMTHMTFRDVLNTYSKNELVGIAKNLHLSGYSNLKKEKLLDRMSVELLDKDVMRKALRFLSESEFEFLEQDEELLEVDELFMDYDTLLNMGYAYSESDWVYEILYVPKEVKDAFRENCDEEWKAGVLKEKELLMYLNGSVELYGMCPIYRALKLYERDCGQMVDAFSLIGFCETVPENKKIFVIQEGELIFKPLVKENLIQDISDMHKNIDYYDPTTEEMQMLVKEGYLPFSSELCNLKKFFRKHGEEMEDAEDLCKRVQFLARIGAQIDDIMAMLEEYFLEFEEVVTNKKTLDELMKNLFFVIETTRTILLRGHSPQEVILNTGKSKKRQNHQDNLILFPKKE